MFSRSVIRHFPIYKSDHAPIMLNTEELSAHSHRGKHFHFEALWLAIDEFQEVVENPWKEGKLILSTHGLRILLQNLVVGQCQNLVQ